MNVTLRIVSALVLSAAIACGQPSSTPSSTGTVVTETAPAPSAGGSGSDAAEAISADSVRGVFVKPTSAIKATAAPKPSEMVTVVVELAAPAVAVVQAQSPANQLDAQTTEAIVVDLRAQQEALRGMIEVLGGTIQNTYQHALNGIRVRLPLSKIGALTMMPGVTGVRHVAIYHMDNVLSVPYIGADKVWTGSPYTASPYHGEGIKVAVIDTGIDYTHANFAGPGTADAYNTAHGGPAGTPGSGDTTPANPNYFGPTAPKVKGGTDLVGDTYDAAPDDPTYQPIPHPDANPLDCAGHGSHVAGTIGGFGVTAAGTTYSGSYNTSTDADPSQWKIGPGVAPKADLYAVRVFGCAGSTDVVTDAIEWAVANHMDVINMSLGASYGTEDSSDAVASTNAEEAGTIVVASAGNSGNVPYIVGSPSTGAKTISVAAIDSHQTWPGAILTLTPTGAITVQRSNQSASAPPLPTNSQPVKVLRNADNSLSLGCSEAEYGDINTGTSNVGGTMVVAARGTCARIYRVQAAFRWGATSASLINNATGYPTFEGDIMSCVPGDDTTNTNGRPCEQPVPSSGTCPFSDQVLTGSGAGARCVETPHLVTIPFFGVQGPATGASQSADSTQLQAATNAQVTGQTTVNNPTKNQITSFSSAGPRQSYNADGLNSGGGHLKPNVAAPGASIFSTAIGTGTEGEYLSGTSMAAPHTAGLTALALQAHAALFARDDVRLAVENTADPGLVTNWRPRLAGSGLIQAVGAVNTQTVLRADTDDGSNLSFGVVELRSDYSRTRTILVRNLSAPGTPPVAFTTSSTKWNSTSNRTHTLTIQESSVALAPGNAVRLHVTLTVPAASAGNTGLVADNFSGYAGSSGTMREVGGYISLTPTGGSNNGVKLTMPYYFVPRARADVSGLVRYPLDKNNNHSDSIVQNSATAPLSSLVDYFSWGATGTASKGAHGIRAAGVKSVVDRGNANDRDIVFAIDTFKPNSTYVGRIRHQVDITFDGNTSGNPDIRAYTTDIDAALSGTATGRVGVIVIDYNSVGGVCAGQPAPCAFAESIAAAPTDGSTVLLPVFASDIGLSAANPRFTYTATAVFFQDDPTVTSSTPAITDTTPAARFNAFTPSLTASVAFPAGGTLPLTLAPGGQARVDLTINSAEWASTPTAGVMIVPSENPNYGKDNQALIFRLKQ